eukprot:8224787-Ditylum_brightwellii.AAC.1
MHLYFSPCHQLDVLENVALGLYVPIYTSNSAKNTPALVARVLFMWFVGNLMRPLTSSDASYAHQSMPHKEQGKK